MTDWRDRYRRLEGFLWWHQLLAGNGDQLDRPLLLWVADALGLDTEERIWFSFLYSSTYNVPCAFQLLVDFPTVDEAVSKVSDYWETMKPRLNFVSDRAWCKKNDCFPRLVKEYAAKVGGCQESAFREHRGKTPVETYRNCMEWLRDVHYLGWFCSDLFMAAMAYTTKFPMVGEVNIRDSTTCREGLCYAFNLDEWVTRDRHARATKEQLRALDVHLSNLRRTVNERFSHLAPFYRNPWTLTFSLCVYRKLWKGTRYLGYYVDGNMDEIRAMERARPDMNWDIFWNFRHFKLNPKVCGEYCGWPSIRRDRLKLFKDTGHFDAPVEMPRPMESFT